MVMYWNESIRGLWTMFANGDPMGSVLGVYTNVFPGGAMWFYSVIALFGLLMVYMKTQNFGTTMVVAIMVFTLLIGANTISSTFVSVGLIVLFVAVFIGTTLYKMYK